MIRNKVLVVDNAESTRQFMRYILDNAGYLVAAIKSAEEALELTDEVEFDAVLTDLLTPEFAGIDLIRELRADERYESIPIIVVSLNKTEAVMQQGFEAGATEWVVKPVSPHRLIDLMKQLCPRKEEDDSY